MEAAMMSATELICKLTIPPLATKVNSIWNNEKQIEELGHTVDLIRDVLYDVEGKQIQEESMITCYKRLRNAFLDAEDFLDRVQTLKEKKDLEARLLKEEKEEINKVKSKFKRSVGLVGNKLKPLKNETLHFFSGKNQTKYALEVNNTMAEVKKNLNAIVEDMQKYGSKVPNSSLPATQMTARASGPYVNPIDIFGRDEDKRKIVDLLLRSSVDEHKIPVVSIVAPGGVGKTTVAQLVYNDERWQESCNIKHRLWVSDSKKLDLKALLKHILKSICPNEPSLDHLELDHLGPRIVANIQKKTFLLVLDDVENEDPFNWYNLKRLLDYGSKESRVLVTTRSIQVAKVVGSFESTHKLTGLSKEDSSQLFESFAFRGARDERSVEIGKLIVEKSCGVPLAIKVIGSLLRDEGKRKWEYFRDKSLTGKKDEGNQIMDILKLSYDNLDPTLKRCFSFCALFPKNCKISRETLSDIWMDNVHFRTGFGETVEDACDKSLRILYNRCFLEATMIERDHDDTHLVSPDEWDDVGYFKLHDLMHDLVKEVAGAEILVVDSDERSIEEDVRHIFLDYKPSIFEPKGRRVRSFLLNRWYYWKLSFDNFVLDCPVLRFLKMGGVGSEILTDSIGKLVHLRYLCLSGGGFQTLPHSIVELINLRKLELACCRKLTHLPFKIGELTCLEVLDLSDCGNLEELPGGIEKLMKLKKLLLRFCYKLTHLPHGMGALISLEVLDLSYCRKLEELPGGIEKLMKLKKLLLRDCNELTHLPHGMGALKSLEVLDLSYCRKLEELPGGIEKLTKLKKLLLSDCNELTHLPHGMGALTPLEVLDLSYCRKLEELPEGIEKLMKLKKLLLRDCYKLTHLPHGVGALTSLEVLDLSYCKKLEELSGGIEKPMKLKKLLLIDCYKLTHLPHGVGALTSLEVLDLSSCYKLVELPGGIEKLMKLRKLDLEECTRLTHLPLGMGALTSLEVLNLSGCSELKELPSGIEKLMNLKKLLLKGCKELARMPAGMGALFGVCEPARFLVGGDPEESNHTAQLEELGHLSDLPAELQIELRGKRVIWKEGGDGEETFAILLSKTSLRKLVIWWECYLGEDVEGDDLTDVEVEEDVDKEVGRNHMEVLGKLKPPTTLEELTLEGYQGMTFPGWMPRDGFASVLPNLASLRLVECSGFRYLPPLSRLDRLRVLVLHSLSSLEYIVEEESDSDAPICLLRLESLKLSFLAKFKGWCRGKDTKDSVVVPSLSRIEISNCCNLIAPTCRSVLKAFNLSSSSSSSFDYLFDHVCKNNGKLSLTKGKEDSLTLEIMNCLVTERASSSYMEEAFRGASHCLTHLELSNCSGLKTLPGLHHLTALRELYIGDCRDFTWEEDAEEEEEEQRRVEEDEVGDDTENTPPHMDSTPPTPSSTNHLSWKRLTTLQHLKWSSLPKLLTLPEGLQYITSFHKIHIWCCNNLQVPDWAPQTYNMTKYSTRSFSLEKK